MLVFADIEDVFRIFMVAVFAFLTIAGWIGQFMKNRQQGAKPAARRRPKDDNVQNEIERFLQEVTNPNQDRPKPPERRPAQPRPAQTRPAQPAATRPTTQDQAVPQRRRPSEDRSTERSVSERQTERPREREPQRQATRRRQAQPDLTAGASRRQKRPEVQSPPEAANVGLPPRVSASSLSSTPRKDIVTALGPSLVKQLRDPAQVRRAIIMNMILGPPKSAESALTSRRGK